MIQFQSFSGYALKRAVQVFFLLLASYTFFPQAVGAKALRDPFTGRYELRYSNVKGSLNVQLLSGNRIKFSLTALLLTGGGETRNGVAEGIVSLNGNSAVYESGECRISMKFLGNRVEVKESKVDDCGFGAFVTAQGTYLRRSRKPRFDS